MISEDTFILDIGSKNNRLRVCLGKFEGFPTIDIRKWYQERGSNEWKRSGKGITLTADYFRNLLAALDAYRDQILRHLQAHDRDFTPQLKQVPVSPIEDVPSLEIEQSGSQVPFLSWRHEGSKLVAVLNQNHPMGELAESNPAVRAAIESFVRSAALIDAEQTYRGDELLSLLIETWGIFSKTQINKGSHL